MIVAAAEGGAMKRGSKEKQLTILLSSRVFRLFVFPCCLFSWALRGNDPEIFLSPPIPISPFLNCSTTGSHPCNPWRSQS